MRTLVRGAARAHFAATRPTAAQVVIAMGAVNFATVIQAYVAVACPRDARAAVVSALMAHPAPGTAAQEQRKGSETSENSTTTLEAQSDSGLRCASDSTVALRVTL